MYMYIYERYDYTVMIHAYECVYVTILSGRREYLSRAL